MKFGQALAAAATLAGAVLVGCTSGQVGSAIPDLPGPASVSALGTLQFAVGAANVAGKSGLNTVETYRKADGTSAVLVDAPTITGPAGFVVPSASDAGNDAGTKAITGVLQTNPAATPYPSTFGYTGGAFGYGFEPENAVQNGTLSLTTYALPFYGSKSSQLKFLGGPPAWPQSRDGTYPAGFVGWTEGFTDFMATPVAGSYALNVVVPASPTTTTSVTASAMLTNTSSPMGTFATPVVTPDGNQDGGVSIDVTVPAGATEALIEVVNTKNSCGPSTQPAPLYYSIVTHTTGPQTLQLPPNLGAPLVGAGGSLTPTPTLCSSAANTAALGSPSAGDGYSVYAIAFDYPAVESAYPSNTQQTPSIVGANGQADISVSAAVTGTMP